jgi:phosphoglycolate phosphatase-like HAD superfamily hydrolase
MALYGGIFDVDGVLLDTPHGLLEALAQPGRFNVFEDALRFLRRLKAAGGISCPTPIRRWMCARDITISR